MLAILAHIYLASALCQILDCLIWKLDREVVSAREGGNFNTSTLEVYQLWHFSEIIGGGRRSVSEQCMQITCILTQKWKCRFQFSSEVGPQEPVFLTSSQGTQMLLGHWPWVVRCSKTLVWSLLFTSRESGIERRQQPSSANREPTGGWGWGAVWFPDLSFLHIVLHAASPERAPPWSDYRWLKFSSFYLSAKFFFL